MPGARIAAARRGRSKAKEQGAPTAWLMGLLTALPFCGWTFSQGKRFKETCESNNKWSRKYPISCWDKADKLQQRGHGAVCGWDLLCTGCLRDMSRAVSLVQRLECLQKVSACATRCLSLSALVSLRALHAVLQNTPSSAIVPSIHHNYAVCDMLSSHRMNCQPSPDSQSADALNKSPARNVSSPSGHRRRRTQRTGSHSPAQLTCVMS